MVLYKVYGSTI